MVALFADPQPPPSPLPLRGAAAAEAAEVVAMVTLPVTPPTAPAPPAPPPAPFALPPKISTADPHFPAFLHYVLPPLRGTASAITVPLFLLLPLLLALLLQL